tara:strand:- start:263 stop:502 length:240 start_codon:yes stop_codon:yes gene_type:complete
MNIKRLINGKFSKYVLSAIIGIGLATLFRKACNSRNCLVFKAPTIDKIRGQVFKYNNKCYTFKERSESCDPNKKIVEIA